MRDLKKKLIENDYSILTSNGYHSFDKGIKPVLSKMREDKFFFKDLYVVDKVIGKASAMLLTLSGVKEVYALLISKAGKEVLEKYQVTYYYDNLVDNILNDAKDGLCPMETTVEDIDDLEEAFIALKEKVASLMKK